MIHSLNGRKREEFKNISIAFLDQAYLNLVENSDNSIRIYLLNFTVLKLCPQALCGYNFQGFSQPDTPLGCLKSTAVQSLAYLGDLTMKYYDDDDDDDVDRC